MSKLFNAEASQRLILCLCAASLIPRGLGWELRSASLLCRTESRVSDDVMRFLWSCTHYLDGPLPLPGFGCDIYFPQAGRFGTVQTCDVKSSSLAILLLTCFRHGGLRFRKAQRLRLGTVVFLLRVWVRGGL